MCTRLLRMSLLATLLSTQAFAVDIHPYAEELSAMPLRERNLVTTFVNAYPLIATPKLGDNSKDTFTMTEKYSVVDGENKKLFSGSCVVTITQVNKVIRVEFPDFFVHSTQSIKMAPVGCALDPNGEFEVEGLTFASGFTSQITKSSIPLAEDLGELLSQWDSWTISGKTVKYSSSGTDEVSGDAISTSETINLGAPNGLCIGSASSDSVKGSTTQDMGEQGSQIVSYEFKNSKVSACQAAKPVYGKFGTDILSTVIDDTTHYCIEDDQSPGGKMCSDDAASFGEGIFPDQFFDALPSFEAPVI